MTTFNQFSQDFRYAFRSMLRRKGFTAVALLTLALGIGAGSAIFSVVNAVLLRPLPYEEPERLVRVQRSIPDYGTVSSQNISTFDFVRRNSRSFQSLAATGVSSGMNLTLGNRAQYVQAQAVSCGYFGTLGVALSRGREFTPQEERYAGPNGVILTHDAWQRLLRGRDDVVGSAVRLGGEAYPVVGIAPEDFIPLRRTDVFVPLKIDDPEGGGQNYTFIGRLAEGISIEAASQELSRLSEEPVPGMNERQRLSAVDLQKDITDFQRPLLLLLQGAVLLLLLIACANTAGLQLARNSARQRELAIRAALGGARRRLLRQLLTESLILAAIGGLLGLSIARWGADLLVALGIGSSLERVEIDLTVLAVTAAASLLTGLLFGLLPALQASRSDVSLALRQSDTRSGGGKGVWPRRLLVVAEVALCLVLLVGAGLLIRTYLNMKGVNLGFDPDNVLTAEMSLKGSQYSNTARADAFFQRSLERIRALPEVEAAAVANNIPVERGLNLPIRIPGSTELEEGRDVQSTDFRYITPGYLQALRVPTVEGRGLGEEDGAAAPRVALVNEAFQRRYFPNGNVVGQQIFLYQFAPDIDTSPWRVVGVVGDVRTRGLTSGSRPTMFVNFSQLDAGTFSVVNRFFPAHWIIRTRANTQVAPERVEQIVREIDPLQPFSRFLTMQEVITGSLDDTRYRGLLLSAFAAIALAMAISGIYGLISYTVQQRTREIGIRMALGATSQRVLGSIVRQGLVLGTAGAVIGIAAGLGLTRFMQQQIYGVGSQDPLTFGLVTALLLSVAALASLIPALRLLRRDPISSLREE
ncbi:MAG TPA: ABC transporter permease [Acidobacteriota bacterium]|nr:ABC transporter permease [Acidobacteriota bacterium]